MSSILIHVSGDRIGDALLKLPVIRALRAARPDARLVWVAGLRRSVFASVLAPLVAGVLDEVHEATGLGMRWRQALLPALAGPYECIVATERKLRAALALRRIPHERFVCPALDFRLSRGIVAPAAYGASVYAQITCLLSLAAGRPLAPDPRIVLPPEFESAAARGLPDGPCYVGFAPGAGGARKRWPLTHYIDAARAQLAAGRQPVWFLGPEEQHEIGILRAALPEALFPELDAGDERARGPLLTIALARRLAVGVANDAGGGHLLAAGGQPLVSLFGHTDERKFAPPYGERRVLRARDFGGTDMASIPLAAVLEAIDELLARTPPAA